VALKRQKERQFSKFSPAPQARGFFLSVTPAQAGVVGVRIDDESRSTELPAINVEVSGAPYDWEKGSFPTSEPPEFRDQPGDILFGVSDEFLIRYSGAGLRRGDVFRASRTNT
jgi:hypothetical protein